MIKKLFIIASFTTLFIIEGESKVTKNESEVSENDEPIAKTYGAVGVRNIIGGVLHGTANGTHKVPIVGDLTKTVSGTFDAVSEVDRLLENTLFFELSELVGSILGDEAGDTVWNTWKTLEKELIISGDHIGNSLGSFVSVILESLLDTSRCGFNDNQNNNSSTLGVDSKGQGQGLPKGAKNMEQGGGLAAQGEGTGSRRDDLGGHSLVNNLLHDRGSQAGSRGSRGKNEGYPKYNPGVHRSVNTLLQGGSSRGNGRRLL